MHSCPFCKAEFEFKDILFYLTREMTDDGVSGGVSMAEHSFNYDPFAGSMDLDLDIAQPQAEEASPEPKPENRDHIGEWATDQIYYDRRITYWKAQARAEERFIVHWDPDEASPGVAVADLWHDPVKRDFPLTVRLCEQDEIAAGSADPLTNIMCPACHFDIPKVLLEIPDENCHSIALIGYPSSGKTQYKVALNQELQKLTGIYNLADSVTIFSDAREFTEREGALEGEIAATVASAKVCPLVLAIRRGDQSFLISIYDLPGEVYRSDNRYVTKLAGNKDLFNADGAILMIDPVQLYSDLDDRTVYDRNGMEVEIQYVTPDTEIFAPLTNMKEYHIGEKIKYLSLVITKTDLMFSGDCGDYFTGVYLRQLRMCQSKEYDDLRPAGGESGVHKGHFGAVKPLIINAVDNEVMHVIDGIDTYNWQDVKAKICDRLSGDSLKPENIRAFAISTLRRLSPDNPDDTQFVVSRQTALPRHRILEPVLYLLARWGVVETDKDAGAWGPGARNPFPKKPKEPPAEKHKTSKPWPWFHRGRRDSD